MGGLLELVCWQTQSRVDTDERSVSSELDRGSFDSDGNNNDNGHDWDLISDVEGMVDKEFDRSFRESQTQERELVVRRRILNSSSCLVWLEGWVFS